MAKALLNKLKEAFISVFPVALIVVILNFTPLVDFSTKEIIVFVISAALLVLGIGLFSLGADLAMMPMGEHIGAGLSKLKQLKILLFVCFLMGVLITVAEPDLTVLASQVKDKINPTVLIVSVGVGVGAFLLLAVLKIVLKLQLSMMLFFFYSCMFGLSALVIATGNADFLALSFDSGGVTTGPITVPFIMALGIGIATTLGGKNQSENSFGLVALCSVGPILAVMVLGITSGGSVDYRVNPSDYAIGANAGEILSGSAAALLGTMKEVGMALGLIVAFFVVLQLLFLKLPKQKLVKIAVGVALTFAGLVIFLTAVAVGFMPIGFKLGAEISSFPPWALALVGLILGAVVVLAEPAVHVLNKQVEEVTDKTVSKFSMMIALSVGVGTSIALSLLRIYYDFNVLFYLVPGYLLSLGLAFFVPPVYTAIAFDSGGVASGPLTSSFILPLAIGVCFSLQPDKILVDAFGVVAMVAMTPLITIQLLGFKAIVTKRVRHGLAMKKLFAADDEQIIYF